MDHSTKQPTRTWVEGTIIRRDGTREDLGVIANHYRNPVRQLLWRVGQLLRGRRAGRINH
jgi:hypothetical protein